MIDNAEFFVSTQNIYQPRAAMPLLKLTSQVIFLGGPKYHSCRRWDGSTVWAVTAPRMRDTLPILALALHHSYHGATDHGATVCHCVSSTAVRTVSVCVSACRLGACVYVRIYNTYLCCVRVRVRGYNVCVLCVVLRFK